MSDFSRTLPRKRQAYRRQLITGLQLAYGLKGLNKRERAELAVDILDGRVDPRLLTQKQVALDLPRVHRPDHQGTGRPGRA